MKYVVGEKLSLETGSRPLKEKFNSILKGKLLVCFEELENFSQSEWMSISSVLKRYITSNRITIEEKNVNSMDIQNINNYIILSNNDSLKEDDDRRIFITDLSVKYRENKQFFSDLYKKIMNEKVGHAFYCYLLDKVDITGFYPQNFPITKNKLDSYSKRLEAVYEFIKYEYILTRRPLNDTLENILKYYQDYCKNKGLKPKGKIEFNRSLKEININAYRKTLTKDTKVLYVNVDLETLDYIANKYHWIHELDEYKKTDDNSNNSNVIEYDEQDYNELEKKYNELEKKYNELLGKNK